jgi:tRNA dimethylallyltransferase
MFATRAIVDEALALARVLPAGHPLLLTIGVEEALDVGCGRCSVDDAIDRVSTRTRQYARRQRTWFRKEPWWERVAHNDDEATFVATALEVLGAVSERDERP